MQLCIPPPIGVQKIQAPSFRARGEARHPEGYSERRILRWDSVS